MHRIFARPEQLTADQVVIRGDDAHHLLRVLRMGVGAALVVVDPRGRAWKARVETVRSTSLTARLTQPYAENPEPLIQVTLAVALLKNEKLEWVMQKATELGVHRIIPVECQRSVKRLSADRVLARTARWQRIVEGAAAQSGRQWVPVVEAPCSLAQALPTPGGRALLASETETQTGLASMLDQPAPSEVTLFTGPEGGFTPEEVALARESHVLTVGLGPRILRAETAALTLLTLVLYGWGDLGRPASRAIPPGPDMPLDLPE